MATEMVRCAINGVISDKDIDLESPRINYLKDVGKELLQKVTESEQTIDTFDKFSAGLHSKLKLVFDFCKGKSYSAMKDNLWSEFHHLALCELPAVWGELFLSLGMLPCKDQLLLQSTNQKLFEKMLSNYFSETSKSVGKVTDYPEVILTKDELNALRYVGGFVPHALLKRYERYGKKYKIFFECLGDMAVVSDETDFLDYTKEWYSKVNRGGLFPLNDTTFMLFIEIEKQTRRFLTVSNMLNSSQERLQDDVIKKITDDENVHSQWILISQSIDKQEDTCWLLNEVVKLYVVIRGFSVTAMWMEQYKNFIKKINKEDCGTKKAFSIG